MRKVAIPMLLVALALLIAACSSPTDKPAQRWIKFLDAQSELVKSGKFDAAKFEAEGAEIVVKLARHRDDKTGKLLMTKKVLESFREANTAFEKTCTDAGNQQALEAFARVAEPLLTPGEPSEE
ncbi:MAG: hypothetical protein H6839_00840 [Planctomycetes bacterium]|nr:hypothetical protein [Planctomycetota bacterium]